jgi:hypothetical protein
MGTAGLGATGAGGSGNTGAGGSGSTGTGGVGATGAGGGLASTGAGGKGAAGVGGLAKDYQGKVITQGGCGCDVGNSGKVETFGISILGIALVLGRRRGSRRRGDRQ